VTTWAPHDEHPDAHAPHGDEQAVAHAGRNVTAWTPHVLHGA
jgi:hypothetical protein